jgi:hypothetical protein
MVPHMSKDSLALRLYFQRHLGEAARIIGYAGCDPAAFWGAAKQLDIPRQKLQDAVYELTRADKREGSPPRDELRADVRKLCFQLLGPAPEHPDHDEIRYAPPLYFREGTAAVAAGVRGEEAGRAGGGGTGRAGEETPEGAGATESSPFNAPFGRLAHLTLSE